MCEKEVLLEVPELTDRESGSFAMATLEQSKASERYIYRFKRENVVLC